jgi:hypothetical protein
MDSMVVHSIISKATWDKANKFIQLLQQNDRSPAHIRRTIDVSKSMHSLRSTTILNARMDATDSHRTHACVLLADREEVRGPAC